MAALIWTAVSYTTTRDTTCRADTMPCSRPAGRFADAQAERFDVDDSSFIRA